MYPLLEALAQVPDFRKSQGKRHPLGAVLALACAATLCGCSSLTAIAQWGREQGTTLLTRLASLVSLPLVSPLSTASFAVWM